MGPPRAPQGPIGPQRARIKAHGSNFEPPGSEFEPGAQIMGPILGPDGRPTSFVRKYYSLRPYLFSLWCGQSLTDARQIPGLQHGVVPVDNPSVATSVVSADKTSVVSADKTSVVSADKTSVVSRASPCHFPHRGGCEAASPVWAMPGGCLGRPQMSCLLTQQMSCLLTQQMSCLQTQRMSCLQTHFL